MHLQKQYILTESLKKKLYIMFQPDDIKHQQETGKTGKVDFPLPTTTSTIISQVNSGLMALFTPMAPDSFTQACRTNIEAAKCQIPIFNRAHSLHVYVPVQLTPGRQVTQS